MSGFCQPSASNPRAEFFANFRMKRQGSHINSKRLLMLKPQLNVEPSWNNRSSVSTRLCPHIPYLLVNKIYLIIWFEPTQMSISTWHQRPTQGLLCLNSTNHICMSVLKKTNTLYLSRNSTQNIKFEKLQFLNLTLLPKEWTVTNATLSMPTKFWVNNEKLVPFTPAHTKK